MSKKDRARAVFIKSNREKRGWPQAQLAEISGLSLRTIQRVEDDGCASLETIKGLATAFDMTVDDFEVESTKEDPNDLKIRFLERLRTGKEVTDIMGETHLFHHDYDEPRSKEEADLISGFFQSIQDMGDIWGDLGSGEKVSQSFNLNEDIKALEKSGYLVFGHKRKVVVPKMDAKAIWDLSTLVIKKSDCPFIIRDEKLGKDLLPVLAQ